MNTSFFSTIKCIDVFFLLQTYSELGMSLAKWVEVNIVDPLTQGRHSLIRETALELARGAVSSTANPTLSSGPSQSLPLHLPADPRTGTISTQILASLHFYPPLLLALSSLVHIKMQKIDMGSLIRTPDELFVSEEEWAGKGIKERKARAKSAGGAEDKMDVDESTKTDRVDASGPKKAVKQEEEEEAPGEISKQQYEMEGPEELSEVLDYVAGVIVELDKRNRNGVKRDLDSSESEDPLMRNLRLNLLALAKRAPLDTIARLPMDLVPEHIRHFVPTLAT
jgi:bromodomain-containing protein 7